MIATLFKHELRRTLRWFLLVALVGVAVTGFSTLLAVLLPSSLGGLFSVLAVIGAGAVPGVVPLWLGIDFYRSSYSKTGYLTRALPVPGTTIFWVKFANAYLLSLLATVVGVGLGYWAGFAFTAVGGGTLADHNRAVAQFWVSVTAAPWWVVVLVALFVALMPLQWLASYFLAATVGSEAWSSKLGLGGPIIVWFVFYFASQAVGMLGALIPVQLVIGDGSVALRTQFINIFSMDSQNVVPIGVFIAIFTLSVAAIVWASVSFDRLVELR